MNIEINIDKLLCSADIVNKLREMVHEAETGNKLRVLPEDEYEVIKPKQITSK